MPSIDPLFFTPTTFQTSTVLCSSPILPLPPIPTSTLYDTCNQDTAQICCPNIRLKIGSFDDFLSACQENDLYGPMNKWTRMCLEEFESSCCEGGPCLNWIPGAGFPFALSVESTWWDTSAFPTISTLKTAGENERTVVEEIVTITNQHGVATSTILTTVTSPLPPIFDPESKTSVSAPTILTPLNPTDHQFDFITKIITRTSIITDAIWNSSQNEASNLTPTIKTSIQTSTVILPSSFMSPLPIEACTWPIYLRPPSNFTSMFNNTTNLQRSNHKRNNRNNNPNSNRDETPSQSALRQAIEAAVKAVMNQTYYECAVGKTLSGCELFGGGFVCGWIWENTVPKNIQGVGEQEEGELFWSEPVEEGVGEGGCAECDGV